MDFKTFRSEVGDCLHTLVYNPGQKSWDKLGLLALLRTQKMPLQLHLSNLAPPYPTYNVEN